jgi:hypothetical protein
MNRAVSVKSGVMGFAALNPSHDSCTPRIDRRPTIRPMEAAPPSPRSRMTNYRRAHVPGATWFFTVNLADRSSRLLTDRIDDLRDAVRYVLRRHPFAINAMVVLPEHMHAVWTLPSGRCGLPLALATDQGMLLTSCADQRAARCQPHRQERARHLAAALPGASDPRRGRSAASCGLRALQPGQARACTVRCGVAAFHVPSLRARGAVAVGLGRCRRVDDRCRLRGAALMGFATLNPSYEPP